MELLVLPSVSSTVRRSSLEGVSGGEGARGGEDAILYLEIMMLELKQVYWKVD